jgi:hypothetical protein
MPDKPEVLVTIRRDPNDERNCIIDPRNFRADVGQTVRFRPIGLPPISINFKNGSPFAENPIGAGPHITTKKSGKVPFDVTWPEPNGPDGTGNGTAEVPPG